MLCFIHKCTNVLRRCFRPGCNETLCRWRLAPIVFLTLKRGQCTGDTIFMRCFRCGSVYGGRWHWPSVPEDSRFPESFHRPYLMPYAGRSVERWFYATPQLVWETVLLQFLLGCMARGGMSLTSISDVYHSLWGFSMCVALFGSLDICLSGAPKHDF